jgi:Ca2+-binding EF-hand superfamily protein
MRTALRRFGLAGPVALLGLAGPASAQTPAPLENFREVFLQLDANGDTVLEREEVPEKGRAAFDRLLRRGDDNEDGKLDVSELQALGRRVRAALGDPAAPARRLRAADKDGDGKVSRGEFPGQPARFDQLDADGDGFLTREEVARPAPDAPTPRPATLPARLAAMDRDGDGKVSREEYTGPPALFDRMDLDRDGFLSREDRRPARDAGQAGPVEPRPAASGPDGP